MKKHCIFIALFFAGFYFVRAQERSDTIQKLQEVVVKAYFSDQPVLRLPGSISVLNSWQLASQPQSSLVSAMNSAPGVRMEERSPGSYRLSIRGSLLRSPFGVRNVKVYLDEFPLTDAGGNTYFNLLDAASVSRVEILKGPESSIFGANSGGVIVVSPGLQTADSSAISASLTGGSYGLVHEKLGFQKQWENSSLRVDQAYQTSNGYRDNSNLKRNFASAGYTWKYARTAELRSLLMYSDLNYQTPGGLTETQMLENPKAARYPTATLPGAVEQRAAITNKTLFGGLLNQYRFTDKWRHVIAVFGSRTDFKNPFITNYEVKDELNGGLRTYLEFKTGTPSSFRLNWQTGMEGNYGSTDVSVYDNNRGERGSLQSGSELNANSSFYFTRLSAELNKLYIEAATSLNFFNYKYIPLDAGNTGPMRKTFNAQLMPRVALTYLLAPGFSWRASLSKGYSTPTIDEVTGSNNTINPDLQPEYGWNYETGFRYKGLSDRLDFDAVVFRYDLKNAIVRRVTEGDVVYFVNAGGTRNIGIETQLGVWVIRPGALGAIKSLRFNNSITYSDFMFTNYLNASQDFSGNRLTGVPRHVVVSSVNVQMPENLYFFGQHNYTSSISLNDAATQYAGAYHLVQIKAGWQKKIQGSTVNLFLGIDNLLDEKYSLGNDLNAAGNRYYNPSPRRNYYFGISGSF